MLYKSSAKSFKQTCTTDNASTGVVAGTGAGIYGWGKMTGPNEKLPVQADKGIEIDISELFGGEPKIYEQQELTSGIDFYDTDEQGNVIQAQ